MTPQQIKDGAPDGATHYESRSGLFYKWDGFCLYVLLNYWWRFKSNELDLKLKPL